MGSRSDFSVISATLSQFGQGSGLYPAQVKAERVQIAIWTKSIKFLETLGARVEWSSQGRVLICSLATAVFWMLW